ncbi:uncharacterized protein LOC110907340 [Helianthus annuus]|uniref:uncharacterized protein LOC110907340 n=1 Tax=Helianthus annuus TaxID=4232 RepID=UPI000B8FEF94|nr:uncharacterized protein LOC110907340 [Helianthus annuus]
MNYLSVNSRGIGNVGKVSWLKGMVGKYNVDFLAIQESMLIDGKVFDFSKIWGNKDFGVEAVGSTGKSGGLISIWNPKKFCKVSLVCDRNFLITSGTLVEDGLVINMVNIYAPQKVGEKRQLWDRLKVLMQGTLGMWIILGDVNTVRWKDERRNSKFNSVMAKNFNMFIDDVSLQEYKMSGNKFTFLAGSGDAVKLSKIDQKAVIDAFNNFKFEGPSDIKIQKKLSLEERDLEEEELWVWEESKKEVERLLYFKNKDLHQKSRVKWASMGDDNSAFFHRCINGRKAANVIPGLIVDGSWVSRPSLVKKEVPSEMIKDLVAPFSKEEIKEAAFDCGSDRAPGPDGFNFSTSFITLIAKTKTPVGLKDYRPINLVGVVSKLISKVIASRIKKIIGDIISESQSAFLKERFILDGPLVLNELISWVKKNGKQSFLLKIDFEKAYDNVSWEFLLSVLDQMGFPSRWGLWIKGILQSARSAVLVNGSPTLEFQC